VIGHDGPVYEIPVCRLNCEAVMSKPAVVLLSFLFALSGLVNFASAAVDESTVRLFQARSLDGSWTAGLEIRLGDGWKTYWRVPGDSGVPPHFDWSRSGNLAAVTVGWPAPRRYNDAAGETIGYRDRVVLPLRIDPIDPMKPVDLSLSLFYAVCKDICIPVNEELAARIDPDGAGSPADQALLEAFIARIPAKSGSMLPHILALRVLGSGADSVLEVAIDGTLPAAATDIFVEGYPKAYFRKPRAGEAQASSSRFHLKIDGLDDVGELRGRQLTLTLTTGGKSLVQSMIVQ
jgi:DsbC/DsbD-like thiol-disulfide interchange protein